MAPDHLVELRKIGQSIVARQERHSFPSVARMADLWRAWSAVEGWRPDDLILVCIGIAQEEGDLYEGYSDGYRDGKNMAQGEFHTLLDVYIRAEGAS